MKLASRMVVAAAALALAAPLAFAEDGFAPYGEDFTRGEPIPPEMLKTIEHARALLAPRESPPRTADTGQRRRRAEGPTGSPAQAVRGAPLPKSGL